MEFCFNSFDPYSIKSPHSPRDGTYMLLVLTPTQTPIPLYPDSSPSHPQALPTIKVLTHLLPPSYNPVSAHDLLQTSVVPCHSANQTPSGAFHCLRINSVLPATANETSQSCLWLFSISHAATLSLAGC